MPRILLLPILVIVVACTVLDVLLMRIGGFDGFAVSSTMMLLIVIAVFSGRMLPQRQVVWGYAYLAAFFLGSVPAIIALMGIPWHVRPDAMETLLLMVTATSVGFVSVFRIIRHLSNLPTRVDKDADDG